MKNFRFIATCTFSFLICTTAVAQTAPGWNQHKCNKDPFTEQISCSMATLESLPPQSNNIPAALFVWTSTKRDNRFLLMLSLSTLDEPKISKSKDGEKAITPIMVRVDGHKIHTIKPADIVMSIKQAPPYRQLFEINEELLEQLAKGEKVFLRFESSTGNTITKEFSLTGLAEKLYPMMTNFMELSGIANK